MLGLASSEGLGRTAMSEGSFQVPDAATAARLLKRTFALPYGSPQICSTRLRGRVVTCSVRRLTTCDAILSFSGLCLRTLLPVNANGRERCPSRKAFLRTTDFASILVANWHWV